MSEDHQPHPTAGFTGPDATPTPAGAGTGAWGGGQAEVLESGGPAAPAGPPARSRGGRRGLTVVAGAGAAALVAAGGAYAWALVGGGGDQAEDHLPATAVSVVRVDLNPSASQKLDAVRFFEKFPEARKEFDAQGGDLRKLLYTKLTDGYEGAPAWSEVEGWLGDRMALAAVPDPADKATAVPVLTFAVTDEAQARTGLAKLPDDSGFVVRDGWAIVSDSQPHAQAVADGVDDRPLSQDPSFRGDVDALGDAGIVRAWFDGRRSGPLIEKLTRSRGVPRSTTGWESLEKAHGAFALRFTGGTMELAGRMDGVEGADAASGASGVADLPESSLAAVGSGGTGAAVTRQWSTLMKQLEQTGTDREEIDTQIDEFEDQTGLELPGDLATLLGQRLAVALGKPGADDVPAVGARVWSQSPDLAAALGKVDALLEPTDGAIVREDAPGGYVLASSRQQADALAAGGKLGSDPRFTAAVPDPAAPSVGFVDVAGILAAYGEDLPAESRAWLDPLASVGMSAAPTGPTGVRFELRVTTR